MQKWNVPTDRVQIVDEKNGVICLVIMFTQENLSVALKYFAQAMTNFLLSSAIVWTPPSPILYKEGIDFLKFGNKGGDEIFFLERKGLG